jgi:hypothetical protein
VFTPIPSIFCCNDNAKISLPEKIFIKPMILVCGLWFVVCCLWFVVCGLLFVVYGLWFVVCGLWFMV